MRAYHFSYDITNAEDYDAKKDELLRLILSLHPFRIEMIAETTLLIKFSSDRNRLKSSIENFVANNPNIYYLLSVILADDEGKFYHWSNLNEELANNFKNKYLNP